MSTDSMKNPLGEIKATLDANLGIDYSAVKFLIKDAHSKNISISNWNDLVRVAGTSIGDVSRLHDAIDVIVATVGTSDILVSDSSSVVDAVNILNTALKNACDNITNLEGRTKAVEDSVSEAHKRLNAVDTELDDVSEDLETKLTRITLNSDGSGADPNNPSADSPGFVSSYDNVGTHTGVYVEHMGSDGNWRTMLRRANNASLPGSIAPDSDETEVLQQFLDKTLTSRIPITNSDGRLLGADPDGYAALVDNAGVAHTYKNGDTTQAKFSDINATSTNKQNTLLPLHYADVHYLKNSEATSDLSGDVPKRNSDGVFDVGTATDKSHVLNLGTADARYAKIPKARTDDANYEIVYVKWPGGTETYRPISGNPIYGKASIPVRDKASQNFGVGLPTEKNHPVNYNYLKDNLRLEIDSNDYTLRLKYKNPETKKFETFGDPIDLPLESMIINAEYDDDRKLLIFILNTKNPDGSNKTLEVPINSMVNLDSFTLMSSKEGNVYTIQLATAHGPIGDPVYIEDTFGSSGDSESWKQALEIDAQYDTAASVLELQLNYIDDDGERVTISEVGVGLYEIADYFSTLTALSPIDVDILQDDLLELGTMHTYEAPLTHFNRRPVNDEKFSCILRPLPASSGNRNSYFCSAEVDTVFDSHITFTLNSLPAPVSVDYAGVSNASFRASNVVDITNTGSGDDTIAFKIGDKSYTKTVNNVSRAERAASDSNGDVISDTYARKDQLTDGRLVPAKAALAYDIDFIDGGGDSDVVGFTVGSHVYNKRITDVGHARSADKAYGVIANEDYASVSNKVAFTIGDKSVGVPFVYNKTIDNVANAGHADSADLAAGLSRLSSSSYGPRVAFDVGLPFEHVVNSVPTKTLLNTDPYSAGWNYNAWYNLGAVTFTAANPSVYVNARDEMRTSSGSVLLLSWQEDSGDEWHTDLVVDGSVSTSGNFALTAGNLYCRNLGIAGRTYDSIAYRWLIV